MSHFKVSRSDIGAFGVPATFLPKVRTFRKD